MKMMFRVCMVYSRPFFACDRLPTKKTIAVRVFLLSSVSI